MSNSTRFDQAASEWDNNPVRVNLARAIGEKISRSVPFQSHWRALDYGAGTGLVTLNLQPHVASIVAVDTSTGMLEMLSKKLTAAQIENVSVRQWDLDKAPYPETGFDLCFSSMTLHHLPNVPQVFRRFWELLKPGGWLAVADLDTEDGSFHGPVADVFHHGFDRSTIREWLQTAGFGGISVVDAHKISKPDQSGTVRNFSVFLACGTRV